MDLENFLESSREKRSKLLRVAEVFLTKTLTNNPTTCLSKRESPDIYTGPTPQKLKLFEEEVGIHLKKIFSPGLNDPNRIKRIINAGSVDDTIRKTYSRNTPTVKKKQLV